MKTVALYVISALMLLSVFSVNIHAQEQKKVIVEAVGFFSHFPMKATRDAIMETCAKFGEQVELTLYDEDSPEGESFMKKKGLSGHLPMRLYINGENTFALSGRTVSFKDFVNREWNADDLSNAIELVLGVQAQKVIPQEPMSNNGNWRVVIFILAGFVLIVIVSFIILKRRNNVN